MWSSVYSYIQFMFLLRGWLWVIFIVVSDVAHIYIYTHINDYMQLTLVRRSPIFLTSKMPCKSTGKMWLDGMTGSKILSKENRNCLKWDDAEGHAKMLQIRISTQKKKKKRMWKRKNASVLLYSIVTDYSKWVVRGKDDALEESFKERGTFY